MKDMAIHNLVIPKERIDRLIKFANHLSTPDVSYFHSI
jgi:hypothetical protein